MSTGVTVLIIAIVVIAIVVIVALVQRSKRRQRSSHIGLPDLGSLSTTGLDKQHAAAPHNPTGTTEHTTPNNRA